MNLSYCECLELYTVDTESTAIKATSFLGMRTNNLTLEPTVNIITNTFIGLHYRPLL